MQLHSNQPIKIHATEIPRTANCSVCNCTRFPLPLWVWESGTKTKFLTEVGWIEFPHSQLVTTLMCDWWVAEMSLKDEWRSVRWAVGGQCVTITGMTLMHWWCADSLEYSLVVSHVTLISLDVMWSACLLIYMCIKCNLAPNPCPAYHRLQYGKRRKAACMDWAWEQGYMHEVILAYNCSTCRCKACNGNYSENVYKFWPWNWTHLPG